MAQKLLQRKWWSSRPHGSCARDGAATSSESFTQRALSSGVPSHRQKPNPPGIQPSAVRLCPKPLEVLSHKQPHAVWQSPLGTFSPAKETKGKKQNKTNPKTKPNQEPQKETQTRNKRPNTSISWRIVLLCCKVLLITETLSAVLTCEPSI